MQAGEPGATLPRQGQPPVRWRLGTILLGLCLALNANDRMKAHASGPIRDIFVKTVVAHDVQKPRNAGLS
jgi:hypothetical protein